MAETVCACDNEELLDTAIVCSVNSHAFDSCRVAQLVNTLLSSGNLIGGTTQTIYYIVQVTPPMILQKYSKLKVFYNCFDTDN